MEPAIREWMRGRTVNLIPYLYHSLHLTKGTYAFLDISISFVYFISGLAIFLRTVQFGLCDLQDDAEPSDCPRTDRNHDDHDK